MKKKGLIISTIVMVVVLIASLTTATYAWFSASTSATIDQIGVSVGTNSNVSIGVYKGTGDKTSATSYQNGEVTYTPNSTAGLPGTLSADTEGLGFSLEFTYVLSSLGGVYTAPATTPDSTFDSTYHTSNNYCNGSLRTVGDVEGGYVDGAATFNNNTDCTVFYVPFGVRVEQSGMNYLYCDITITAESNVFWGVVTSLFLDAQDGGSTVKKYQNNVMVDKSSLSYNSSSASTNSYTYRIVLAQDTTTPLGYGSDADVYYLSLLMFLDGTNSNCIQAATLYNATIDIEFDAAATADYDASDVTIVALA